MTAPFSISYPSVEAALSALGEKVLGAAIVIEPVEPVEPVPAVAVHPHSKIPAPEGFRFLIPGETLQAGDRCWVVDEWQDVPAQIFNVSILAADPSHNARYRYERWYVRPIVIEPTPPADQPSIPALEPGWLFYGRGPLLRVAVGNEQSDVAAFSLVWDTNTWSYETWAGSSQNPKMFYAIRANTELARLNGLEPIVEPPEVDWQVVAAQQLVEIEDLRDEVSDLRSRLDAERLRLTDIAKIADGRTF